MARITPERFLDFITYFRKDNCNHVEAMKAFAVQVDPALMDDTAPWVTQFRTSPNPPGLDQASAAALITKQQLASIWICGPGMIKD
jgi:hypothetical protein